MLLLEERALITDLQDKIIDLLVRKEEARRTGDEELARRLQRTIERLKVECTEIRRAAAEHCAAGDTG